MGVTWLEVGIYGVTDLLNRTDGAKGGNYLFWGRCLYLVPWTALTEWICVLPLNREWPSVRAEEAHHVPTLEQHFWCPHQQWPGHAHRGQGQKCWNGLRDHGGAQGAGREVQKEQWEDRNMGEHHSLLLQNCWVRGCVLVSMPGCGCHQQHSRDWLE